jgi:hypothetical protein
MHVVTPGNASSRAAAIGWPQRLHNFFCRLADWLKFHLQLSQRGG